MIKLFRYEGFRVTVSEEALTLKPFKEIWDRDKSKSKETALSELALIYFFSDPRSDYQIYYDKDERLSHIIEDLGLNSKWKPDKKVKTAIEFYESFKSVSALLLEDTRMLVDKLRKYLREIDFNEKDDKGKPIYPANMLTSTVKQIPDLIRTLEEAERVLNSEAIESSKMKGNKEKSILDDGI